MSNVMDTRMAMNQRETYDRLTDIFREVFDRSDLTIGPETTAKDIPGWDSQTNITLLVATESYFGIRFRTAEIEQLRRVQDLADLVRAKSSR
jgi:acyl carrier protein